MDKKRILLVEDDQYTRELYEEVIKGEGYMLDSATNGEEGLEKIKNGGYNLILLDVMMTNIKMPKINGLELLQMAKEIKSDLKVIVCTGCHDLQDEAIKYGAYAYFKKPIIIDTIKDCLQGLNSTEK